MQLVADRSRCQGYGVCMATAPAVFDMDDEDKVVLLVDTVDDFNRRSIEEAVDLCPTQTLSLCDT